MARVIFDSIVPVSFSSLCYFKTAKQKFDISGNRQQVQCDISIHQGSAGACNAIQRVS